MLVGVIGLGRMGGNISRRLMRAGHESIVFDANPKAVQAIADDGATAAHSLADLVDKLGAGPRAIWVMLPAGHVTEETVSALGHLLGGGDMIVDGGNSYFRDDIRRAKALEPKGIRYLDAGTSGGVWGLERGYCLMVGGDAASFEYLEPLFAALAPGAGSIPHTPGRSGDSRAELGYIHAGPVGAGHFVKMIHNGIEYGMMQAFAEGFDILASRAQANVPEAERYRFDLPDIAEVWRRGSVVTSWLLDLTAAAFADDKELARFSGYVEDSGEGRWTVEAAVDEAVPAEVLSAALYTRFRSRREHTFAEKVLSAMRLGFGGHIEGHGP